MTNHWSDIGNTTNIVVWGANPVENHPACVAHMNRARFPKQFFKFLADGVTPDPRANKQPAKLIVIDPRRTRTALQVDETRGDRYVRIRPGTDIAFGNGLMRYMLAKVESMPSGPGTVRDAFFAYLNKNNAGQFYTDGNLTAASTTAAGNTGIGDAGGNSVYTDARFLVKADGTDYQRDTIVAATGNITAIPADSTTITNFPLKAATVDASPDTVYNRLKSHVSPYTLAVTADICGCSTADIQFVGDAFIANSRCSTGASTDPRDPAYRATTMLYAMGITQHTCGGQNVKTFAQVQMLMGNMGRAGGGINALRGIHNVQGSTDMGLLYGNIPGYSGNPGTQVDGGPNWTTTPSTNNAFGKYVDALWGNPCSGTNTRNPMNGSYDDAYGTAAAGLQQRGFYNMTLKWFGDYTSINALTGAAKRAAVDACFSLWPKGNGDDHITMFRKMGAGDTKALVAWGQNPAVTEPNQGKVRAGLYNLDLLVCVDMFENETAAASRKPTGVTFLIPTAAHVEKAGSATNSGRTLQWRYEAAKPAGNTKDDNELLLRFAKALDDASAFSHIKAVWDTNGIAYDTSVYKQLYGNPYGGYLPGTNTFAAISGTAEVAQVRKAVSDPIVYNSLTVLGSEWAAESIYREMCTPTGSGGTLWIYTGAYNTGATWTTDQKASAQAPWAVQNKSKSRDRTDDSNTLAYHGWGYAWLVNRRVLYNNGEVVGDVADFFMGPDSAARLFVSTNTAVIGYSRWYRTIHRFADKPSPVLAADTTSPHYAGNPVSLAGRFPAHTEPYETPRQNLLAKWGRNTKGTSEWDLVKDDTRVAGRGFVNGVGGKTVTDPAAASFPLVLTTIRCVEHFQGGPITRNNWSNVEFEPEPWIEINSANARYSDGTRIADGDYVRIVTPRTVNDAGVNVEPTAYGSGFRARVGTGLTGTQKVGVGVVAIPWHWGEKGLSTGSRANDLTIDAMDANTTIPEFKACLCRLEKI